MIKGYCMLLEKTRFRQESQEGKRFSKLFWFPDFFDIISDNRSPQTVRTDQVAVFLGNENRNLRE